MPCYPTPFRPKIEILLLVIHLVVKKILAFYDLLPVVLTLILEPSISEKHKIELFAKIVNDLILFTILPNIAILILSEAYLKPCQTFKMVLSYGNS